MLGKSVWNFELEFQTAFPSTSESRSARIRTLCRGFGGRLLSQEHTPDGGQVDQRDSNPYRRDHNPPCCRYTMINVSTPTRIRTRNASFVARDDRPFHHRGSRLRESRTLISVGLHNRGTERFSSNHAQTSWARSTDQGSTTSPSASYPLSGPRGSRTLISGVRGRRRPVGPAALFPVIPDGLEPSLPGCGPGVFAAGPRDHFE